jgi:hypothetical protein
MPDLPSTLVEALKAREVIPFVGAGVSRAVLDVLGQPLFPTWLGVLLAASQLLRAEGLITKANRVQATLEDNEYLDAAKVARDALGSLWFRFLKDQFDLSTDRVQPASLDVARAIWGLGSPLVVTTNYDKVLRWACPQHQDLRHWTVSDRVNLVDIQRDSVGQPAVWHLHGFIDRPEEIVITPDGYATLYPADAQIKVKYDAALDTLRHLLTARTFLFIGFGMEDAIQRQIRWVRETFAGAGGRHFVLLRAKDCEAMEKELEGLSVQPVRFADFGQPLLDLLRDLATVADSGGLRTSAPLPRVESNPRPYLEYLRNETAYIEIRGLTLTVAEAPRFPIGDLYIPLLDDMESGHEIEGSRARRKTLDDCLARTRLVILGDPGSGKTTFLRRIANAACQERLADDTAPFPLLLRISDLCTFIEGHERKDAPALVSRLLAQQTQDLTVPLDEYFFDRQLTKGPCLLLIDGLDEAPNEAARETVSRLIERAARAWPNCRFVVTTRPKAYDEEVMLADFHHARIGPLEPDAVRTFLQRWAAALIPENPERAKRHGRELIEAVESRVEIRRIAGNPVMLTALAVLHWNEKRMPEQRADLYDSILLWLARSRKRRPGRLSPEACIKVLQELAGAMQGHPEGRQVQVPRDWAARAVVGQFQGDLARARDFLEEEEKDSGIVVNRGADVRFWHLTFQEFLAARLLANMDDAAARHSLLFAEGRAWLPEWREVVLLLAGILHGKRAANVNALVSAALDDLYGSNLAKRMFHWMGAKPNLAAQARCFGLLGAMLRDLQVLGYTPPDRRYAEVKNAVLAIFEPNLALSIPLKTRLAAADALGQAGDPRLRLPRDPDYWVKVNDEFAIGRYPVTVHEYKFFVDDGGPTPPDWDNQSLHPNCPVVRVTWFDAKAYCDWAHVRLPTGAEWERAARGAEGREYPWGNQEPDPRRANYDETKLGRVSPVGLFPQGCTPEGIADLAGNVLEWVDEWYDDSKGSRVVRGGAFFDIARALRAAFRYGVRPGLRYNYTGFRCVREVFP